MQTGKLGLDDPEMIDIVISGFHSWFATFIIESLSQWEEWHEKGAIELLLHAQECSFTDYQDKIYAFVGFTGPRYRIIPDYQIDTSGVLQLACKRIIVFEGRLDVLCYSIPGTDEQFYQRREYISSWTPDWTSRTGSYTFIYDFMEDLPLFRASSDYPSAACFHSYNMVHNSILRIQCIFIDQLSSRTTIGYKELVQAVQ